MGGILIAKLSAGRADREVDARVSADYELKGAALAMAHADDVRSAMDFLDGESRQVWARRRITNEPVFIEPGTAAQVREIAKVEWACIVPGCDVPISTRGGSKRDHFFHVSATEHPGGNESLNHLAAKAMLARWAALQFDGFASVFEEQTIKGENDLHRRPDVLITWDSSGDRVALEVEYKHYAEGDWRQKQSDLNAQDIVCTWLFGHTRISSRDVEASAGAAIPVKVPYLASVLSAGNHNVLVVNPITLQIGTLAGTKEFDSRLRLGQVNAYLMIDALADCGLTPGAGLVTPAAQRLDAAIEERHVAAARERDVQAAAGSERAVRSTPEDPRWREIRLEREGAWSRSPHRVRVLGRWGRVPPTLSDDTDASTWIHALAVHWHTVIYETVIHGQVGATFGTDDCWNALQWAGIKTNWTPRKRFRALVSFLDRLVRQDIVERVSDYRWKVIADLDVPDDLRRPTPPVDDPATRESVYPAPVIEAMPLTRDELRQREAEEYEARVVARRRKEVEDEQRWQSSELYDQLVARYGSVPKCISWPNAHLCAAINAPPALWRAQICVALIQDAEPGRKVTVATAREVLENAGTRACGESVTVDDVIGAYLFNLMQRGLLRANPGDSQRFSTTGAVLS